MTIKNAFSAFGIPADEATIDTLRTDIAFALREFIERSGLGQAKVGELLGLKQSVVSHIVRGEIEHLSVERLIKAMVKAGLPGFAEWGASAEEARAGTGYRTADARTAVIFTDTFQMPTEFLREFPANAPANAGHSAQFVRAQTGTESVTKVN